MHPSIAIATPLQQIGNCVVVLSEFRSLKSTSLSCQCYTALKINMASGVLSSLRSFSTIFGKTINVTAISHGKYLLSKVSRIPRGDNASMVEWLCENKKNILVVVRCGCWKCLGKLLLIIYEKMESRVFAVRFLMLSNWSECYGQ